MTPFFVLFIGILLIGLAKFIKFFGVPAPFGLGFAVVGLLLIIGALVAATYEGRK